jgi:hypothetical protein
MSLVEYIVYKRKELLEDKKLKKEIENELLCICKRVEYTNCSEACPVYKSNGSHLIKKEFFVSLSPYGLYAEILRGSKEIRKLFPSEYDFIRSKIVLDDSAKEMCCKIIESGYRKKVIRKLCKYLYTGKSMLEGMLENRND